MTTLRALLDSRPLLTAPACYDALGAVCAKRAGFPALYVSGESASASLLGRADNHTLTLTEMVCHALNIREAAGLPVICDAENGFGGLASVERCVREFSRAGISAIHIEDKLIPQSSRPVDNPEVIQANDAADRIAAACRARRESDMMIIARTDALPRHGMDEAVARIHLFHEAGADLALVAGLMDPNDLEVLAAKSRAPLVALFQHLPSWWDSITEQCLAQLGYKLLLVHASTALVVASAFEEYFSSIASGLTSGPWSEDLISQKQFRAVLAQETI